MMTTPSVKRAKSIEALANPRQHRSASKRATFHLLRVSSIEHITDDAVAITFDVPEHLREEFFYKAGQHVAVRATIAGDDVRRNYSICAPAGSGVLRIGVKRLPDGVFSSYAAERLRVGDSLEVLTPSGTFSSALDDQPGQHYGAVAAGSGITPILSIIATALDLDARSTATLIYLNQSTSSIMFLEDLEDLKNKHLGRLQIVYVLDGERQEAELLSGRLDAERLNAILDGMVADAVDQWFLCGPLPLTDMIRQTLLSRGAKEASIHRELFHASTTPPRMALPDVGEVIEGYDVTAVLDGRSTSFKLPPNTETILDAAKKVRGEVPYACKNGVCGTCRCKLVSGSVEMVQNFALEADEVEKGYVLACQSYPTADGVVVDFDQ